MESLLQIAEVIKIDLVEKSIRAILKTATENILSPRDEKLLDMMYELSLVLDKYSIKKAKEDI
jgi:hypothetical protein